MSLGGETRRTENQFHRPSFFIGGPNENVENHACFSWLVLRAPPNGVSSEMRADRKEELRPFGNEEMSHETHKK